VADVPVTHRIQARAVELLEGHAEGIHWADLNRLIIESDRAFRPKTVNGTVWKLEEKSRHRVYKPEKGLFRLTKYR